MKKQIQGVMLLEALIGILIFSIGILGLVGLLSASIRNTTEARYRGEAAYLANQIIGRMWTDRANLAAYELTSGTTCNSSSTAALQIWLCQVEAGLPGITAAANRPTITVDDVNTDTVTVTLRWQLPASDARQYSLITRIN
jgi:type IV pilus assembly protein PilV